MPLRKKAVSTSACSLYRLHAPASICDITSAHPPWHIVCQVVVWARWLWADTGAALICQAVPPLWNLFGHRRWLASTAHVSELYSRIPSAVAGHAKHFIAIASNGQEKIGTLSRQFQGLLKFHHLWTAGNSVSQALYYRMVVWSRLVRDLPILAAAHMIMRFQHTSAWLVECLDDYLVLSSDEWFLSGSREVVGLLIDLWW